MTWRDFDLARLGAAALLDGQDLVANALPAVAAPATPNRRQRQQHYIARAQLRLGHRCQPAGQPLLPRTPCMLSL